MPQNLVETSLCVAILSVCICLGVTVLHAQQPAAPSRTIFRNNEELKRMPDAYQAGLNPPTDWEEAQARAQNQSEGDDKLSYLSQRRAEEHKMSLEELERRVRALEDLEEIRKLHQRYIDLMDNLRYQEVLDLFTDDATVEVRNSGVKKGRKELAEVYLGLAKTRGAERFDGHMAVEPAIVVEGNSAKGTWLIYMLFSKPSIQWVQGKNECEYRKKDGRWKIAKLKFTRTLASDPSMYP